MKSGELLFSAGYAFSAVRKSGKEAHHATDRDRSQRCHLARPGAGAALGLRAARYGAQSGRRQLGAVVAPPHANGCTMKESTPRITGGRVKVTRIVGSALNLLEKLWGWQCGSRKRLEDAGIIAPGA